MNGHFLLCNHRPFCHPLRFTAPSPNPQNAKYYQNSWASINQEKWENKWKWKDNLTCRSLASKIPLKQKATLKMKTSTCAMYWFWRSYIDHTDSYYQLWSFLRKSHRQLLTVMKPRVFERIIEYASWKYVKLVIKKQKKIMVNRFDVKLM